jgi:UDP-N-acetylmuramyl pentapeptide phosphotransferase/UDP-N-acetylglucosamine-1-phosphate transferase
VPETLPSWLPPIGLLLIGSCLVSGLFSCLGTAFVIRWATNLGVIDRPNERSSHQRPTPRGGGIAVVALAVLAAITFWMTGISVPDGSWAVLVGAIVIATVSGFDDVSPISPRLRLAVQISAAVIAIAGTGPIPSVDLGSMGQYATGLAGWILPVFWIVGMTNAFNFMDGIDGIAGITAIVAIGVIAAAFAVAGEPFLMLLAASTAAAAAGFLVWNWPPARIFMGDVGSAFLGYLIAVLPLMAGPEKSSWLIPLTAFVMWPFLFDTVYTMARRILKKENVLEAHRSHIYQRLVIKGFSHSAITCLYGLLGLVAGGAALYAKLRPGSHETAELAALGSVILGATGLIVGVHVAEAKTGGRVSA